VLIIAKKKLSLKFLNAGELLDTLQMPNAFSDKLFGVFAERRGALLFKELIMDGACPMSGTKIDLLL